MGEASEIARPVEAVAFHLQALPKFFFVTSLLKSHGHLRKLYLNYRTAFFGSDISRDVACAWDVDIKSLAETEFILHEDGELEGELEINIKLNPVIRFEPKVYKMTLLHEMAHVKLYPYLAHGKKFDQEMLRLACCGAFNSIW